MKTLCWILRNDVHGTHCRVRTLDNGVISERRAARIRRRLCPVAGCRCSGNALGTRGPQTAWIAAGPLPGWFRLQDVEELPGARDQASGITVPERLSMGGLFDE